MGETMASNASPPSLPRRLAHLVFVRLVGFGLVLAAAAVLATVATRLLVPPAPSPSHQWIFLKNLLLPVVLVGLYGLAARLLERRAPTEISIQTGVRLFPLGVALGAALVSLHVLALMSLGAAHPAWDVRAPSALAVLDAFLVPWLTAVGEELLFRAILFRLLEEALGTALATLISAALFGLAHAGNPGAGPESLFLLAGGFGVLAALVYAATRNLWAVVGLHMGWNLAEGTLFGLPNSGQLEPVRLLQTTVSGPPLMTGDGFGPEGSLPLFALSAVAIAAFAWITLLRGQWRSLRGALQALRGR
jgi:membrane protease YdiL (CAAX protease family)